MPNSSTTQYQWLNTSQQLQPVVQHWLSLSEIFLDTEFIREKTFYPELALIQVFDGERCYLIEPDAADNASGFSGLLADSSVRKVFHSASEDCEVLYRHFNVELDNLWDTQIAAAYLGKGISLGYGGLIEAYCGKTLEKGLSRSDWQQRPLSNAQIQYALDDVIYLAEAYEKQNACLTEQGIDTAWIEQDCQALAQRVRELDDLENAFLDVKNAWKLRDNALLRLYLLAKWREQLARQKNIPKTFIIRNDVLFMIAQQGLSKHGTLPSIKGWHPASRRKYEKRLIAVLEQAEECSESEVNTLKQPLGPDFWQKQTLKMQQAREKVDKIAANLGIEPDVLCSKKLMRNYIKYLLGQTQHSPRGWTEMREHWLAEPLASIFMPR